MVLSRLFGGTKDWGGKACSNDITKVSVTVIVKQLKGITAKWLFQKFPETMREHFWGGHIWSPSYYVGSIGVTTEAVVKNYIETQ